MYAVITSHGNQPKNADKRSVFSGAGASAAATAARDVEHTWTNRSVREVCQPLRVYYQNKTAVVATDSIRGAHKISNHHPTGCRRCFRLQFAGKDCVGVTSVLSHL